MSGHATTATGAEVGGAGAGAVEGVAELMTTTGGMNAAAPEAPRPAADNRQGAASP